MTPALSSFDIQGFRAFEQFTLERLGGVNLFVGRNNVGKTCLLEALWVYANQGSPAVLWSLLEGRDESISPTEMRLLEEEVEDQLMAVRYLFFGRGELGMERRVMQLGPINALSERVTIKMTWLESLTDNQGNRKTFEVAEPSNPLELTPGLSIQFGQNLSLIPLDRNFINRGLREKSSSKQNRPCLFLPAKGLSNDEIGKLWDTVTLGPLESEVMNTLRMIEPGIERINLVATLSTARSKERTPIVKMNSLDTPVTLRSLGEGMNRMFGLALALVNAKGGLLLVDEVESGFH